MLWTGCTGYGKATKCPRAFSLQTENADLAPMKKIYHLSTCTTNQRILRELKPGRDVILQDIKTEPMTAAQIDSLKKLAGSYEALFSRVALKYRKLGLHEKKLTEKDYRKYILEEYTFLRRPVIVVGDHIFIGNAAKSVAAAKAALAGE
jgi:arsenate reductase